MANPIIPVYVLTFLATFGHSTITPVLALYSSSMGASHSMVGGIISIQAAAQLVTQVPMGKISDKIGRKKLIFGAFLSTSLLALLYSFGRSPGHFLILQALSGLAMGCLWPPIMAQLADLTPVDKRGRVMGTFNTLFFMGIGTGPLAGSYASSLYGYASVFNIWALIAGLGTLLSAVAFKEIVKSPAISSPEPGIKTEKIKLLKPGYWPTFFSACAIRSRGGFCQSFNNSMLPLYAVALFSASQPMIGALMSIHAVMLAFFNIPGGMMADKWGRKSLALVGTLAATVGVLWYSFPSSYWTLFIAVGLAGAGAAFSNPALAALVGDICNHQKRGEAYGYFLSSFQLGIISGALIYGILADILGLRLSVLAWGFSSLSLSLLGFLLKETLSR